MKRKDLYKRRIEFIKNIISDKKAERTQLTLTLEEYRKKIDEQYQRIQKINDQQIEYERLKMELKNLDEEIIKLEKDVEHETSIKNGISAQLAEINESIKIKHSLIDCVQYLLENFSSCYENENNFKKFKNLKQQM